MADIRTSASKAAWLPCYIMSCRTGPKCPLSGHQRWREKCVRLQRHRVTSSVKLSPFSVQRSRFRPLFAHIASPPVPISKLSVSTVRLSTRYSSKLAIIRCEAIPPRLRSGSTTGSVFDGRGGYADGAKSAPASQNKVPYSFQQRMRKRLSAWEVLCHFGCILPHRHPLHRPFRRSDHFPRQM